MNNCLNLIFSTIFCPTSYWTFQSYWKKQKNFSTLRFFQLHLPTPQRHITYIWYKPILRTKMLFGCSRLNETIFLWSLFFINKLIYYLFSIVLFLFLSITSSLNISLIFYIFLYIILYVNKFLFLAQVKNLFVVFKWP